MKLVNSKTLKRILESNEDSGLSLDEIPELSPCWEINMDRENGRIRFLVDKEERLSFPLSGFEMCPLEIDDMVSFLGIFKTGELESLRKALRARRLRGVGEAP
jgi:hypothetical protein